MYVGFLLPLERHSKLLLLAHLFQVSLYINVSQNFRLVLDLLLHFQLVVLHLLQQLGHEGTKESNRQQGGVGRVIDCHRGSGHTSLYKISQISSTFFLGTREQENIML